MSVCLVTGGAGFIGSHLVEALVGQGHEVRVLDNFSTGSQANLARVTESVEIIAGDVTTQTIVRQATQGTDCVFHLAPPSFSDNENRPLHALPARDVGTSYVLNCAHAAGARRVVFASTFHAKNSFPFQVSRLHSLSRHSQYAAAKFAAEQHCAAFGRDVGMETVCLRYFHVFGPRQSAPCLDWHGIQPILRAAFTDQRLRIHGLGSDAKDMIYVDDVVHATLLASSAPRVAGHVYDIGRGRYTTMAEVVALFNAILGIRMKAIYMNEDRGVALPYCANTAPAEAELGFVASVDIEQGLRRCIAYFRRHSGIYSF